MKSWTSTRRPAWAPPPKSWISGRGSRDGASPARYARAAAAPPPRRHARRRATWRSCALPPRRDLFGVPSSSIRRVVDRFLVGRHRARSARGDLAVHRGHGAGHVMAAEARRRRRGGRPPRPTRSRRRPARSPGPSRRLRASPPPRRSAGRANPRRGGRRTLAISRVTQRRAPRPGVAHCASVAGGAVDERHGDAPHALAVSSRVTYSTGDLPSTRARNSAGQSAAARLPPAPPAAPSHAAEIGVARARRRRRGSPPRRPARRRHLRSKWLRQKARSKAGSPYQAHSASRKTGPSGPARMFFGLTSPWTSATSSPPSGRRAPRASPRARGAAGRWRGDRARAGAPRTAGRSGTSRRPRCRPRWRGGSRASRLPTDAAKSRSTRPAISSAFHRRWSAGSSHSMTKNIASSSWARTCGAEPGHPVATPARTTGARSDCARPARTSRP